MNATKALAAFDSDDTQRFEELLEEQLSSNVGEIPVAEYMDNGGLADPGSFDNRISNVHDDADFVYADLVVHFEETHPAASPDLDRRDSYKAQFKLRIDKTGGEIHFEDGGYRNTTDDFEDDEDDE